MKKKNIFILLLVLFLNLFLNSSFVCCADGKEALEEKDFLNLIKNSPTKEQYPQSPAICIFLDETDYINENAIGTGTIHIMIKILDDGGKRLGEINIPFNSLLSKLSIDFARTIRPDGSVVSLKQEDIRELDIYTGFPIYNNLKVKSFSMPSIEPGCIIEYKATIIMEKPIIKGVLTNKLALPIAINVISSDLIIDTPASLDCKYIMKNLDVKPKIFMKEDRKIYTWALKNIAIGGVNEPLHPPDDDIFPYILFSTDKSWEDISDWFYTISSDKIIPDENIKGFVNKIMKDNKYDKEKIAKALYYFVSNQIRYVSIDMSKSEFMPHDASGVFLNRYGDCKDKSALLISMLKAANIDAYFALLKTRDKGALDRDVPCLQFNHCIVALPDKEGYSLLDPTIDSCKYEYLPWTDQGVELLIVKKGGFEFITTPIAPAGSNISETRSNVQIKEDLSLESKEVFTYAGEEEISARMAVKYTTENIIRNQLVQKLHGSYPEVLLENYTFSDPLKFDENFTLILNFIAKDYVKKAGNLLIFNMPSAEFINSGLFGSEKRIYPINFHFLHKDISDVSIDVPKGYTVKYLPENIELNNSFAFFKKTTAVNDGKIKLRIEYELKKLMIPLDEYSAFKEFVESIIKEMKKSIVFENMVNSIR